ncbi:peptidase C14, caspase catalytic [Cyathus striatus]|nr:peptidase C14, caspase catalytic [Cyathus striatus]
MPQFLIYPNDPLPRFNPAPRAILLQPIYGSPTPSINGGTPIPLSQLIKDNQQSVDGSMQQYSYTADKGSASEFLGKKAKESPPSNLDSTEEGSEHPDTQLELDLPKDRVSERERYFRLLPPSHLFSFSKCTGRKKGVCIGINYDGQSRELKGCVNDARHMRDYLVEYHGFQKHDILLLTDEGGIMPTRKNMIDAMKWLVGSAKKHDSLFLHYSGHGGQVPDDTGRENDGMDEAIYPVDYKQTKEIIDNELHKILVEPLPPGCRLTAVFDACHSGTVLDLPYLHSAHGRLRGLDHVSKRMKDKHAAPPGDVISFAACKDDETSADTFQGGVAVGAMSYALIKTLKAHPHISYDELLSCLRKLLIPKYHQKAQLSSTYPINRTREFVI